MNNFLCNIHFFFNILGWVMRVSTLESGNFAVQIAEKIFLILYSFIKHAIIINIKNYIVFFEKKQRKIWIWVKKILHRFFFRRKAIWFHFESSLLYLQNEQIDLKEDNSFSYYFYMRAIKVGKNKNIISMSSTRIQVSET